MGLQGVPCSARGTNTPGCKVQGRFWFWPRRAKGCKGEDEPPAMRETTLLLNNSCLGMEPFYSEVASLVVRKLFLLTILARGLCSLCQHSSLPRTLHLQRSGVTGCAGSPLELCCRIPSDSKATEGFLHLHRAGDTQSLQVQS